jgi:transcriptional regulator with XRE-family HTH domain
MAFSRGECQIKPLLVKIGMSQAELARKAGYSPRMISFFANDDKPMSVEAMWKVSNVIGCYMEDLYSGLKKTEGSE